MLRGYEVQPGADNRQRVVFHFDNINAPGDMPGHDVRYVSGYPSHPGSGKKVEMSGQLFLTASFRSARAGTHVPHTRTPGGPIVAEVRYLGGFEGGQSVAIGVSTCHGTPERAPYDVTTARHDVIITFRPAPC